jgi:hypothetical protein
MPALSHAPCHAEGLSVVTPNTPTASVRDRLETLLVVLTAPLLIVGYYAGVAFLKLLNSSHE